MQGEGIGRMLLEATEQSSSADEAELFTGSKPKFRRMEMDLQKLIGHVAFAASTEESRPILNGVLWELRSGEMRMVATNGHRLARMTVPAGVTTATSTDFIVPPAALQQVQRLFAAGD